MRNIGVVAVVADTIALFGGSGSDLINAVDGISGNDVVDGAQGLGADQCTADPGDTVTNCP
jgi:hypothetical protein